MRDWRIWRLQGEALEALERYEDALSAYTYALAQEPRNANLLYDIALVHQNLGDYDAALSRVEEALLIAPTEYFWQTKGDILSELECDEEALNAYNEGLRQSTAYWADSLHARKGTTLMKLQRYDEALSAFNQALAISKHNNIALRGRTSALEYLVPKDQSSEA